MTALECAAGAAMTKPKKLNWKSVPDTWPKPVAEIVAALRGALVDSPRPPSSLRFTWAAMLWKVVNAVQQGGVELDALAAPLRAAFPAGAPRKALITVIEAQLDLDALTDHTEIWERGPWSANKAEPWLTPFHPGVELAACARVLLELEQAPAAIGWMAQLHLRRRTAVARFTNARGVPFAREARAQQLAGWKKFVDARATATFGFATLQTWAQAEIEIATRGKVGTTAPPE
ncbi:MAG TPA: hypothetical protein VF403_24280 [Kofleriaceae bacterium]